MKLISIQVGLPKRVLYRDHEVETGIFKETVKGPVQVNTLNLQGDKQADLTVHGGQDKAVYAFSLDAYPAWKQMRPNDQLVNGAFGENLTVDHLPEDQICVGDTYQIGDAILQAVQPRFPCYKLAIKFDDATVLKTFTRLNRPGVYFRVLKEGLIDDGQEFKLLSREPELISIVDFLAIQQGREIDESLRLKLSAISSLPASFKRKFGFASA